MSYQPHYISAFEKDSGLNAYYEPFLLPEKAFPELEDAYVWRGRVKKREGFDLLGRLRRSLTSRAMGNISSSGAGTFTFNIFSGMGLLSSEPNASVELGNITNISIAIAAPINQTLTNTNGTSTLTVVGAGPITAASINYATGILSITFSGAVGASAATFTGAYYPGLPVMALPTDQTDAINAENLFAFDTKYAYRYVGNQFEEIAPGTTWRGTDSNFFWTKTYWPQTNTNTKFLWATNFNNNTITFDPLRYFTGASWVNFTPLITANDRLWTCKCLLPYKGRLLFFNTWEGTSAGGQGAALNFPQRLRYSQVGDPIAAESWRSDIVGRGGFIDCPTDEELISVAFIKDVLVVKFERSSWKIIYTGNETFPFYFEKINSELGSESTFSLVQFDRGVFSVGNVGITTDDSVNVYRIDQNIPQLVFNIENENNGPERVHGIRDFYNELVYWTYPNDDEDPIYPNRMLVYNYINQSFAVFHDSFTCFGYFQAENDKTWSTFNKVPVDYWKSAKFTWTSGQLQARFPDVVAGNQQGFVLTLANEKASNDESLMIRSISHPVGEDVIIESRNHNLQTDDFVMLRGIMGITPLNDIVYKITKINSDTFYLNNTKDLVLVGTYTGGGLIIYVNNIKITTKIFTPYYEIGGQARVPYLDFFLSKTDNGRVTCNFIIDENNVDESIANPSSNQGLLGSDVLLTCPENLSIIPYQAFQDKIWHRFFIQAIVQNFKIQITMSDAQMLDLENYGFDFVMHALVIYTSKNARLIQ